ncbi:MAG: hypothetical protein WC645_08580 [Candidatus Margulisiibacteriota bacterium]
MIALPTETPIGVKYGTGCRFGAGFKFGGTTTPFAIEEARLIGRRFFFRFTVFPNYFSNGIGVGLGTAVNCSFVSPDRIQVDAGVGSASWTSDVLTANVFTFPASVEITWDYDYPGYSAVMEFRTAETEDDLALEGWTAIGNGDTASLNLYYQWRIAFTPIRSWAFYTLAQAEANDKSAWAILAEDAENPLQSYATYSILGTVTYIENVLFSGELRLPAQDILDGGSLSLSAPPDFSSLISGDHSMTLLNRNYQYGPRHANFVFAGENDWQRKNIRVEFGFITPAGAETATVLLYKGQILKWGPAPQRAAQDSFESGEVEIYSRDALSLFMEQKIGVPDDEGNPNPVVCGQILREATALGDNSLDDPVKDIDYEGNILEELSSVDLSGASNVIELSTTGPYEGTKCLRAYTESAGYARGWIDLPSTSDNVLFKTKIKFSAIPVPPIAYNISFLKIRAGGSDLISLEVNSDYRVYLNYNGTRKETDWYINANQDIWQDLSIGILGRNPGLIRVSLNGDQILNYDQDGNNDPLNLTSLAVIQKVCFGITVASAETWDISFDNSKLYNIYYPEAYYVPGAPYTDIGAVYIDGVVKVQKTITGITQTYSGGKAVDPIDMTKIPAQGLVVFEDIANPPSGSVFLMLTKDANTHPVDAIEAVLTNIGRDDLINAASFAAAKAARPNDSGGYYFEDMTAAEAILAITQRFLMTVIIAQGEVKLISYDGAAPIIFDWEVNATNCAGLSASDDSETKKNKVTTEWSQYDRNRRLFYAAKDQASIVKIGEFAEDLDFSWGNEVGSDNGDMARNRADCLLNRLKGSQVLYEDVELLLWKFIRAEIGDTAQVSIPYHGPAEIFRILGKDLKMTPPYELKLQLALFPGES